MLSPLFKKKYVFFPPQQINLLLNTDCQYKNKNNKANV